MGADERTKRLCPQLHTPGWSLCTWAGPEQEAVPRLGLWANGECEGPAFLRNTAKKSLPEGL